jgi:hypothetical protein
MCLNRQVLVLKIITIAKSHSLHFVSGIKSLLLINHGSESHDHQKNLISQFAQLQNLTNNHITHSTHPIVKQLSKI